MKSILIFRNRKLQTSIALLIVFLIDLMVPLGIAVGSLYIFCIFLIAREEKETILIFSLIVSVLTVAKLIIYFDFETSYLVFVNRGLTLIVIWVVAGLAILHRKLVEKHNTQQLAYLKELKEMLYITNHEIRQPIANCMGLLGLIDSDNPSKENLMKISKHLKTSIKDLDTYSKKLNAFLVEKGKMHKI